ncbi:HNH endonuclease [uncultured Roseivirga sp.]|uniref:HNH endonuclease n=1 Tax=uncultured Roseivirga sp. TaxID=543088 RepID=UPI000D78C9C3|nr:HNH endonuclease [uncultured Roseivirga sp.]PWL30228.1 MAG: HNH endonuclease [Roseivirga sp. XM-24bin3]
MNWIISANSRMYDHSSSFEHYGSIDWRQGNTKFEVGDVIYIYCTKPLMMIQYKCVVEKVGLDSDQIRDDKEYWFDEEEYFKSLNGKFMTLRLIDQVSNVKMKLEKLKEKGLKAAPQGPIKIKDETLLAYIETHFSDNYQIDFFPDILLEDKTEYEGATKSVIVNKYERSSKARENAVRFHGLNCTVCGLNFEEMYGEIGEGFIHIHHLVPIHKVGKDYKINYKSDLVPVCPNCHCMLHRKLNGEEPSVNELKEIINNRRR